MYEPVPEGWQVAQTPLAPPWLSGKRCWKVAPPQELVLWHCEHCPGKWFAGRSPVWQARQSVWPAWLNVALPQLFVLWHCEHCPA